MATTKTTTHINENQEIMTPTRYHRRKAAHATNAMLPLLLVLLSQLAHTVQAWIPPKFGMDNWEPVDEYRKRMGIEFNYTPALLHPEICRYMTEEECRLGDQNLKKHGQAHRALARKLQYERQHNPNIGTIKVLVLLVIFEDHQNRKLIPIEDVQYMWNTLMPEWFDVNSHGNYDIEPVVRPWLVTPGTEAFYSDGKQGVTADFQKAAHAALDACDNEAGWDWGPFDMDNDGKLDSVVITHSGYGAETQMTDENGTPWEDRIWAHAFAQSSSGTWESQDKSVSLNGYTVASAFEDWEGQVPATIGLTTHEYMHTFDIIDLYDLSFEGNGIGAYDIMAEPYGLGDANKPGHLSTWTKMEAEWITPTVITHDGIYTARPLETTSDGFQIRLQEGFGGKWESLLFENRKKLEFDVNLFGEGLAIYHVDDNLVRQDTPGFPGQSGWPDNGKHYRVAMLGADGNYHMEQGVNKGDAGDLWQPGQVLGPGTGGVYPNTDAYAEGFVYETGITVTVLENEGENVRFEISGLADPPDGSTPGPTKAPTKAPTKSPTASPTKGTTGPPTKAPTKSPTKAPTKSPTASPTKGATGAPTKTPTGPPTGTPTTGAPTTGQPTTAPDSPTRAPSLRPSRGPTPSPSAGPTKGQTPVPSIPPTISPTSQGESSTPTPPPYIVASVTGRPTPLTARTEASVTPRPTSNQIFATISKETPQPSTGITRGQDAFDLGLLQPPEDNGVIATDFDNTPAPVPEAEAGNPPTAKPTYGSYTVAVDMSSHGKERPWTHPVEFPATNPYTSPPPQKDFPYSFAPTPASGSSAWLWFSTRASMGLVLLMTLLEFR